MKKFKISMIAVVAIVMGIAVSAFTAQKPAKANHPLTTTWFKFMGDPSNLSQLKDNTEYSYVDGLPCSGQDIICAVQYTGNATVGSHPDPFSSAFQSRITNVYNGSTDAAISEEDQ
jgi:hypothetical protein